MKDKKRALSSKSTENLVKFKCDFIKISGHIVSTAVLLTEFST
jgi:hypothetical protein